MSENFLTYLLAQSTDKQDWLVTNHTLLNGMTPVQAEEIYKKALMDRITMKRPGMTSALRWPRIPTQLR